MESSNPGGAVEAKGIGRKAIDKAQKTYKSELEGKSFAYDGERILFTLGSLPGDKLEFTLVLDKLSSNRIGRESGDGSHNEKIETSYKSKTFKVEIIMLLKSQFRQLQMRCLVEASAIA